MKIIFHQRLHERLLYRFLLYADALKISNKLRDADTMTGAQFEAADVTGEVRKSIADALKVSNFLC